MGQYVTAAEVKAWRPPQSAALPDWSNWTDEALEDLILSVEADLEAGTQDIWYLKENEEVILNGKGRKHLYPKDDGYFYPCRGIDSIHRVEFDGTEKEEYTSGKNYVYDANKPWYLIWNISQGYSVRDGGNGLGWPQGQRNLKVVGTFGTDGMPTDLKSALCQWITAEALGPVFAGMTDIGGDGGKVQEVWEDYTVTYGRSKTSDMRRNKNISNISGYLAVDRILSRHINFSGLLSIV